MKDRIAYFDNELTKYGDKTIDEVVMQNAKYVHLESLTDSCFMLIMENEKHHWHLNIYSRGGRAKVEAHLYED